MQTDYDPSLPSGILYRRDQFLSGKYSIRARFTYHADAPQPAAGDDAAWKMYQPGYGLMGLAIGSKSLLESFHHVTNTTQITWSDDGEFSIVEPARWKKGPCLACYPLGDTLAKDDQGTWTVRFIRIF